MKKGTTITPKVYCETLKILRRFIRNKKRGMLTYGDVFPHDNASLHTAARIRANEDYK
jgi:hypothetical protein